MAVGVLGNNIKIQKIYNLHQIINKYINKVPIFSYFLCKIPIFFFLFSGIANSYFPIFWPFLLLDALQQKFALRQKSANVDQYPKYDSLSISMCNYYFSVCKFVNSEEVSWFLETAYMLSVAMSHTKVKWPAVL